MPYLAQRLKERAQKLASNSKNFIFSLLLLCSYPQTTRQLLKPQIHFHFNKLAIKTKDLFFFIHKKYRLKEFSHITQLVVHELRKG
jgi:hypothetical protein